MSGPGLQIKIFSWCHRNYKKIIATTYDNETSLTHVLERMFKNQLVSTSFGVVQFRNGNEHMIVEVDHPNSWVVGSDFVLKFRNSQTLEWLMKMARRISLVTFPTVFPRKKLLIMELELFIAVY